MKRALFLRRRFATLIEMVVFMAILTLVAGVIGVKINQAMQEQRFRTEVTLILDRLRLAQNLMLILNEDVKVHFKKAEGGIQYSLSFECFLDKGWEREFSRPQFLTAVRHVDFKGDKENSGLGEFSLDFMSGGTVMSKGILRLSTGKGRLYSSRRYVCLPGNPAPIVGVDKKPDMACLARSSANEDLTQFIMPDIISKFQVTQTKGAKSNSPTP